MIESRNTRTTVRIQTPPEYDPRSNAVRPGALFSFDLGDQASDIGARLYSATTSKRLNEPCGRFALKFAADDLGGGRTWADVIPTYSLVEIWMQDYPRSQQPVLVMLGLTSACMLSENLGQQAPDRYVMIHGRELSCIFVDQKVFRVPAPPEQLQPEKVSSQPGLPPLFTEAVALLGMYAIDPEIAMKGDSPVSVMDRFVRMCTEGVPTQWNKRGMPLVNFDLPITIDPDTDKPAQTVLSDLLIFDGTKAEANLFDPKAELPATALLKQDGVSLWQQMEAWSDPHYQELFVRSVDLRETLRAIGINRPQQPVPSRTKLVANELLFRKKPFAGRIDEEGNIVGTHDRGSQFDDEFIRDPMENVAINDSDIDDSNIGRTVDQSVVNVYRVRPRAIDANAEHDYNAIIPPLIDDGTYSPASVRRFGPRLMKVDDYYFRDGSNSSFAEVAKTRARLLWHWHRYDPLFKRGTMTLKGNPYANVGMRLIHDGRHGSTEYYITGVTHTLSHGPGPQDCRFLTRVEVDRGWPIPAP